jgi:hypothetical protein
MTTNYELRGRVEYLRRPTASTLLFAMAKKVAKWEANGELIDFAILNFAPSEEDGDYDARIFVQNPWGETGE